MADPLSPRRRIRAPKVGDMVLMGSLGRGFLLLDADSRACLAGPFDLAAGILMAQTRGATEIWRQLSNRHGAPIGIPFPLATEPG